jgi:hypothetical protein
MINASYGVTVPSSARTSLANRSIRTTRTPACSVIPLSRYHSRGLRKISATSSVPASMPDNRIRL